MGQLALAKDLKKAWSVSIGAGGDRRDPLISQPVVADGMVFTLDTKGDMTAFSIADGQKKWRESSIPKGEQDTGGIGGGIAYAGGKLYVTNGYKQLACFEFPPRAKCCGRRRHCPRPRSPAPTVANDKVFVITLDDRLMVYSTTDGTSQWNYSRRHGNDRPARLRLSCGRLLPPSCCRRRRAKSSACTSKTGR